MKTLKLRTKKFCNITFQLLVGNFPENSERMRNDNINFLFVHSIHKLKACEDAYDRAYSMYVDHEKAKMHAFEILNAC